MKTYLGHLNQIATASELNHRQNGNEINWYHPYRSIELDQQREKLFNALDGKIEWEFKGTKPYVNQLSKGCELCGQGEWSCLFITGICNASCFYCPTRQDSDELPQTQQLRFEDPDSYVEYINRVGFKGISFSGGEPLMVFDRTLEFLRQVRSKCDPAIYIWMYTNGILISDEKLQMLGEAGLDEIRFDLGAVNYHTKVIQNAARFIPHVTVEIPAVPGHKEQLLAILPELCSLGVSNLNLHQLRLTTYNSAKLLQHEYTYLHGEQPVVAESELCALEIIQYVLEKQLPIGVNYCNFQYKNRFQKAGFRNKMAALLKNEEEELTLNGYLRSIEGSIGGKRQLLPLSRLAEMLDQLDELLITYSGRMIENTQFIEGRRNFRMGEKDYQINEGLATQPLVLGRSLIEKYLAMMEDDGKVIPNHPLLFEAWKYEFIEEGMRDFF